LNCNRQKNQQLINNQENYEKEGGKTVPALKRS